MSCSSTYNAKAHRILELQRRAHRDNEIPRAQTAGGPQESDGEQFSRHIHLYYSYIRGGIDAMHIGCEFPKVAECNDNLTARDTGNDVGIRDNKTVLLMRIIRVSHKYHNDNTHTSLMMKPEPADPVMNSPPPVILLIFTTEGAARAAASATKLIVRTLLSDGARCSSAHEIGADDCAAQHIAPAPMTSKEASPGRMYSNGPYLPCVCCPEVA